MTFDLFSKLVGIDCSKLSSDKKEDVLIYFINKDLNEFLEEFPDGKQTPDAVLEEVTFLVHYGKHDLDSPTSDLLKKVISGTSVLDFKLFCFSEFADKYTQEVLDDYVESEVSENNYQEIKENAKAIVYGCARKFFDFSMLSADQLLQLGRSIWGTYRFDEQIEKTLFFEGLEDLLDSDLDDYDGGRSGTYISDFAYLYEKQKAKEEKEMANKQVKNCSKNNNLNSSNGGGTNKNKINEYSAEKDE